MESLGINLKLLIAQIVNFIIVMLLLWKFAYTPVLKMLTDRKDKIAQGILDAEAAAKSLAKAEEEASKIRDKSYAEAKEILKNARDAAGVEATELVTKANDQADRVVKTAKEEASQMKDKTMSEAKKEISDVVIIALDKIVGKELNDEQKKKLTSKAIAEL